MALITNHSCTDRMCGASDCRTCYPTSYWHEWAYDQLCLLVHDPLLMDLPEEFCAYWVANTDSMEDFELPERSDLIDWLQESDADTVAKYLTKLLTQEPVKCQA